MEKNTSSEPQNPVAETQKLTASPAITAEILNAAVAKAVRTAIRGLESKIEAKRPRQVVEKHYNIEPGAFDKSVRIHNALVAENERAERLLVQLRQARAELLNATGASR
jgi:hypothetical protein